MRTVALHNLGCSKNQIDGERMLAYCAECGFTITDDFRTADLIIVNTCSFIREATQEAIHEILETSVYKKKGKCKTLAVAGCFSERYRNKIKNDFPEVDLWLGVHDWPAELGRYCCKVSKPPSFIRALSPPVATQYLKIAEGCSHRCSFCAIPAIRGNFASRPEAEIIAEARWLEAQGVKECILVSQDTAHFGKDRGSSLLRLLERLMTETGFPWIRLMYLHPQFVSDGLLRLVSREKRLVPYFDIPFQHISDDILLSMKRRPLSRGIRSLIGRIRDIVPDVAIRTTFIVGYPGEKARHFNELLKFMEWARFERCGVFPFSPEQGTPAFSMKKRPRIAVVSARCDEIMAIQRSISKEICASRIGSTIDVIVDRRTKSGLEARSRWDAPEVDGIVQISKGNPEVGSIVPVTIVSSSDHDLVGRYGDR